MNIRRGTVEELIELWGYKDKNKLSDTARFFIEHIQNETAHFWTMEQNGKCFGELYVFFKLDDQDFADGDEKAYLCAFRIAEEYRHQGLGTTLIKSVMDTLKQQGIKKVTIGVDETEDANYRLYKRLGFDNKIKDSYIDPCNVDGKRNPQKCDCFWLLSKDL